ncbi:MAG: hypothetical protein M1831_005362 [Alyxoria varia]|nr:MAG: hypothetical protein M1831_005362 [Alyxoria varia]
MAPSPSASSSFGRGGSPKLSSRRHDPSEKSDGRIAQEGEGEGDNKKRGSNAENVSQRASSADTVDSESDGVDVCEPKIRAIVKALIGLQS